MKKEKKRIILKSSPSINQIVKLREKRVHGKGTGEKTEKRDAI